MPLTDAQLVLLSAASQRPDGLLPRPGKIGGAALTRFEGALLKAGLATAVPVQADQPSWRCNDADMPIGLHITPAGLAAIGVEAAPSAREPTPDDFAAHDGKDVVPQTGGIPSRSDLPQHRAFRSGSKSAQLVGMLSTAEGTTSDALVAALMWQPHTVRAALTRLRQSGFTLRVGKDGQNRTVYRIADAPGANATPVSTGEVV